MSYREKKYNDFKDMPLWLKAFTLLNGIYKLIN